MKLIDQNIPAELLDAYKRSLRQSTDWHPGSNIYTIRTRQPFRLPHMQSNSLHTPSPEQLKVRDAFKKCIDCYKGSPKTGGAVPPEVGYRSREWWYNQAQGSGMWYFNYMLSLTWWFFYDDCIPEWCGLRIPLDHVDTAYWKDNQGAAFHDYDDAWADAWTGYLETSWTAYGYELDWLGGYGRADNIGGWNKYKGRIHVDKAPLVFKPCEHVSEHKWLQTENIKIVFKTQYRYNAKQGGHIRFVNSGEVQAQDSGQTTFYIPSEYWNYDEMVLTFETYSQDNPDMKPFEPVVTYSVQTCGYDHEISEAALYCVGKGLY